VRVNRTLARTLVARLIRRAEHLTGAKPLDSIQVFLQDDTGMRALNRICFQSDTTTDVISIRYDPMPGTTACHADVAVNTQQALRCIRSSSRWPIARELALYLAHGIDHLTGACDSTPRSRRRMRRRELRWLNHPEVRPLSLSWSRSHHD